MGSFAILVLLLSIPAREAAGQASVSSGDVRVVATRIDPETPRFAQPFELNITLRASPSLVVFLPDTLEPAEAIQSVGAGVWSAVPGPGDSVEIRAVYPVIAFREGRWALPSLNVGSRLAGPADDPHEGIVRRATESGTESSAGVESHVHPLGAVLVSPHPAMDEAGPELIPRPIADVLGGNWSVWLIVAAAIVSLLVISGGMAIIPPLLAARGAALFARIRGRSPRQEALRELDRIRSLQWHRNGRIDDFYAASTDTIRHFTERIEPTWNVALTSSELVQSLEERWGRARVESLISAVDVAERVKFGRYRPTADAAEMDWVTMRDWIRQVPNE